MLFCRQLCKHGNRTKYTNITADADVDGPMLEVLLDDFQELQQLVPQASMRLKLKSAVRKVYII